MDKWEMRVPKYTVLFRKMVREPCKPRTACTISWERQPFEPFFFLFQITSVISFLNYFTNRLIKSLMHLKKYNEPSILGSSTMALAFCFLQFILERRSKLTMGLANFLGVFHFLITNLHLFRSSHFCFLFFGHFRQ